MMDLHQGDWRETLADVEVDAVITDPPYDERTHTGASHDRSDGANVRDLSYSFMTPDDVHAVVKSWASRTRSWFCAMTSTGLIEAYRDAYSDAGRYDFAPVVIRQPRVRSAGDGPASEAVYLMVSRPRGGRFLKWGSLPGWYDARIDRSGHIGGKPLELMRAIVRDYSRPGDLIADPFAGLGTTLLAAAMEGRRAVGSELDPSTYERAAERLSVGVQPDLLTGVRGNGKPKQATLGGVTGGNVSRARNSPTADRNGRVRAPMVLDLHGCRHRDVFVRNRGDRAPCRGDAMKICVWDATEKSLLFQSWRIGARLFGGLGVFDRTQPVRSWGEVDRVLVETRRRTDDPIELQIWGHGRLGQPLINGKPPPRWFPWSEISRDGHGLVWFRGAS